MGTLQLIEGINMYMAELKTRLENDNGRFATNMIEQKEDTEAISNLMYEIVEDAEFLKGYIEDFNNEIDENKFRR